MQWFTLFFVVAIIDDTAMLIKQVSMKYMERSAPYAFMSIENSF